MIHTMVAAVPTANIWDTGTDLAVSAGKLFIVLASTGIAWFLCKELFKVRSVMAGVVAIASALFLGWGVTQYDNKDIRDRLTNTVKDSSGGGDQVPAKSGGGAQAPVKKG